MPELPEVETTLRGIAPHISGKTIVRTTVRQAKLRHPVPPDLNGTLNGETVLRCTRRAKYLLVHLPQGILLIHLGMSGSLRIFTSGNAPDAEKHDHVEIEFSDGTLLRYHDPRRFGIVSWYPGAEETHPLLQNLAQELAVNLEAPVALTAALLPVLASQPQAAVVNITTGLALAPKKSAPVYCAAKAGLHNFTRALRYQTEAAAPHIRVQEIVPPLVDTRMTAGRGSGKLSPEAVADAVVRAIESGRAETCIGKIRLLKWLLRLAPSAAYRILRNE